jgi:Asp-tRNA(Asn)/Glu-tRNA(Gln) amidotransferase A subunit family amidase
LKIGAYLAGPRRIGLMSAMTNARPWPRVRRVLSRIVSLNPAVVLPSGVGDEGLPIGVQLVGARLHDEEPLSRAKVVDKLIGGCRPPHGWE